MNVNDDRPRYVKLGFSDWKAILDMFEDYDSDGNLSEQEKVTQAKVAQIIENMRAALELGKAKCDYKKIARDLMKERNE